MLTNKHILARTKKRIPGWDSDSGLIPGAAGLVPGRLVSGEHLVAEIFMSVCQRNTHAHQHYIHNTRIEAVRHTRQTNLGSRTDAHAKMSNGNPG